MPVTGSANERCGVYAIVNKHTGEWYAGQSVDLPRRFRQQFGILARGKSPCRPLQAAYDKLGPGGFAAVVLEMCPPDRLDAREQAYIDIGLALGVAYNNATRAGWPPAGHRWSDESRSAYGEIRREIVSDPAAHQRLVDGLAKRSPEWLAKTAGRFRGWSSDPNRLAQHRAIVAARSGNPEWRAKMTSKNRAFWSALRADPDRYAAWRESLSKRKPRRRKVV